MNIFPVLHRLVFGKEAFVFHGKPLLFLIYVNGMAGAKNENILLYAGDTAISVSNKHVDVKQNESANTILIHFDTYNVGYVSFYTNYNLSL